MGPHNFLIRSIGLISLPLLSPWQFKERAQNYAHMLAKSTIFALKNTKIVKDNGAKVIQ
jgi:hypothetical protein